MLEFAPQNYYLIPILHRGEINQVFEFLGFFRSMGFYTFILKLQSSIVEERAKSCNFNTKTTPGHPGFPLPLSNAGCQTLLHKRKTRLARWFKEEKPLQDYWIHRKHRRPRKTHAEYFWKLGGERANVKQFMLTPRSVPLGTARDRFPGSGHPWCKTAQLGLSQTLGNTNFRLEQVLLVEAPQIPSRQLVFGNWFIRWLAGIAAFNDHQHSLFPFYRSVFPFGSALRIAIVGLRPAHKNKSALRTLQPRAIRHDRNAAQPLPLSGNSRALCFWCI